MPAPNRPRATAAAGIVTARVTTAATAETVKTAVPIQLARTIGSRRGPLTA